VGPAADETDSDTVTSALEEGEECRHEVRWELITAPKVRFQTPDEARAVIDFFRKRALGEAAPRPDQQAIDRVASRTFDWMIVEELRPPLVRRALLVLPVGQVSLVLEDEIGFHLVRVLERRCAQ
jgi:hypothetical protein